MKLIAFCKSGYKHNYTIRTTSYLCENDVLLRMHKIVSAKRKGVFQHAPNALNQIILHMRKVSFEHKLSIDSFYSAQRFCLRQRRTWSDCADAQSDLSLPCPNTHCLTAWPKWYIQSFAVRKKSISNIVYAMGKSKSAFGWALSGKCL